MGRFKDVTDTPELARSKLCLFLTLKMPVWLKDINYLENYFTICINDLHPGFSIYWPKEIANSSVQILFTFIFNEFKAQQLSAQTIIKHNKPVWNPQLFSFNWPNLTPSRLPRISEYSETLGSCYLSFEPFLVHFCLFGLPRSPLISTSQTSFVASYSGFLTSFIRCVVKTRSALINNERINATEV